MMAHLQNGKHALCRKVGTVMHPISTFKGKLKNKGFVLGTFMKTTDLAFVEAVGYSGFDYCILDMEHETVCLQTMQNLIRAAEVSKLVSVVRVPGIDEESIGSVLDIGASGIQVPKIDTAFQAREAVRLAKYIPQG